jgi:hypothetical protein
MDAAAVKAALLDAVKSRDFSEFSLVAVSDGRGAFFFACITFVYFSLVNCSSWVGEVLCNVCAVFTVAVRVVVVLRGDLFFAHFYLDVRFGFTAYPKFPGHESFHHFF